VAEAHFRKIASRAGRFPVLFSCVFLLIFFAAALNQPDNVSEAEARLLWIVRDSVEVRPALPRDAARAFLKNVQTTLERTSSQPLLIPYTLLLDAWTWIAGDSAEITRIFCIYCVMIGVAGVLSIRHRVSLIVLLFVPVLVLAARQIGVVSFLVMIAALMMAVLWRMRRSNSAVYVAAGITAALLLISLPELLTPTPDWHTAVVTYLQQRNPLEPAITSFTPDSSAGYYDYRYGLRQGIAPDLAWRDFSPTEIEMIVSRLTQGSYPLWLIMPRASALTPQITGSLEARGFSKSGEFTVGETVFAQYKSSD
jgi:hypothetical protein